MYSNIWHYSYLCYIKYSSTGNNLVNDNNQESHTYSLRLPKTVKLVCELKSHLLEKPQE